MKATSSSSTTIKIKGVQENSLIDWEGKIVSTIFLPLCNFRCPFCYAVELVKTPEVLETIPLDYIKDYLNKNKKWVDGVVICGGEPTVHSELPEFIRQFKEIGILVKLDTNGSKPEILRELIERHLIDYVAMDIKAPLDKYSIAAGVAVNSKKIIESIEILKEDKINYEFRTTVVPAFLQKSDIKEISKLIKGSQYYALQQFLPAKTLNSTLADSTTFTKEDLEEMADIARQYVKKVSVRAA